MFTPYFLVQHLSWDCHPCTLQHQKGESQQLREVSDLIGVPIASWLQSLIFIHCSSIWVGILTVHGTADNMRCSMLQQVTGAEDNQLPGCQVVQLPSKSPPAHCSGLAIGLVDDYRAWFDPFRVLGVPWCWNNMGVSALTAASFCQSSPFHHLGDENQSSHSSLYSSFLKKAPALGEIATETDIKTVRPVRFCELRQIRWRCLAVAASCTHVFGRRGHHI